MALPKLVLPLYVNDVNALGSVEQYIGLVE